MIGVLALQGAFIEHEKVLERLGVPCRELRQARDLEKPYDCLLYTSASWPGVSRNVIF